MQHLKSVSEKGEKAFLYMKENKYRYEIFSKCFISDKAKIITYLFK